jgi:hypothetical protein
MFTYPLSTETEINASVAAVRKELLDINGWDEWNPMVKNVTIIGELNPGTVMNVHFSHMDNREANVVIMSNNEKEFSWLGTLGHKWIFAGEHFFRFVDLGNGKTNLIHGENFSGLLVYPLMWSIGGQKTVKNYAALSEALQQRIESKNL